MFKLLGPLGLIVDWFAKIGIGTIATKLTQAYLAKQNAETERERIHADIKISNLEAKRDVLLAESGYRFAVMARVFVRLLFAVPPAIYFAKLWLWDKVLSLGTTDPISDTMLWVALAIITFYFWTDDWRKT